MYNQILPGGGGCSGIVRIGVLQLGTKHQPSKMIAGIKIDPKIIVSDPKYPKVMKSVS